MTIEQDIRTFLIGPSAATSGCSSSFTFVGPMRPAKAGFPVNAVCIQEYGGLVPHGFLNGNGRKTFRRNDVQIRVRGPSGSYAATKNRTEAIWHALNRPSVASLTSVTSLTYLNWEPFQSGPVFMGENDTEQPEFVFTLRVWNETPE